MRKNIIALMLALPLLFVFIVFSSGNVASLGVNIAVSSVSILGKPENGTLRLDLATYENDCILKAQVYPENASDKTYFFRTEEVEGAPLADVSVDGEGRLSVRSVGTARLVAVSADGGYTDSVTVIAGCSKPYDLNVSMQTESGEPVELTPSQEGYAGSVATGRLGYAVTVLPEGFSGAKLTCESEDFAFINEAARSILLPFSGTARLKATIPGGVYGDVVKYIDLEVARAATETGFTVNGGATATLSLERETREVSFFVEADAEPTVLPSENIESATIVPLGTARAADATKYRVDLTFTESPAETFDLTVQVEEASTTVSISFLDFAFEVRSDLPVQGAEHTSVLIGTPVTFYAFPAQGMETVQGVTYEWSAEGADAELQPNADGSACIVTTRTGGTFRLTAEAKRGGFFIDMDPVVLEGSAVRRVTAVQIANDFTRGLARRTTVAGEKYESGQRVSNRLPLNILSYDVETLLGDVSDLDAPVSSDPSVATVEEENGGYVLVPKGKGEVTISIAWQGNGSFGASVGARATVNVDVSAVEVTTSPQLYTCAEEGKAVVLGADILLGTDDTGAPLPKEERAARLALQTMRSTYNIHFYTSQNMEESAYVKYAIEFKNDVYGNGYLLDAEYFSNVKDGSGVTDARFFRGPIDFVNIGEAASVAGQDNIAFLVRTDNVTLSNLTLLGCSDASLITEEGGSDLSNLNEVGTTLELNASASLLNCRVRNGRNTVRAYGGNRSGDKYFIESLDENTGCEKERIKVRIEGCVLSHAREFLLKIGANRALRAGVTVGMEPDLLKADGTAYLPQTNDYLRDDYFYEKYVMTDVTLKDSVLETSGLFTVGLESNFAGSALYGGEESIFRGWSGAGGTSFASVLRLEGDVRLYDWKRLDLVDSSTLIQSSPDFSMHLNIAAMLNFVCRKSPSEFGVLLEEREGKQYVHGGIACYGGGKNYAQISFEKLDGRYQELESETRINISVLKEAEDKDLQLQGELLPNAAGTQDFRFFLYKKDGANNLSAQELAARDGTKYTSIKSVPLFS